MRTPLENYYRMHRKRDFFVFLWTTKNAETGKTITHNVLITGQVQEGS